MNTVNTDLKAYYAQRADQYETIYAPAECQHDLAILHERVADLLEGHDVLEVACGTGYWTAQFASSAASVMATDINQNMLDIAKEKKLPGTVRFAQADALNLQLEGAFTACFAGFWWSHVKREEQSGFLEKIRAMLGKDGLLVMIDSSPVEDGNTPIARTDLEGNTYQIRRLPSGERYEVLKNFPTDSALRKKLGSVLKDIRVVRLEHYWMLSGKFK